ncbi:MAG: class I SAM-dependent methyltransferase [bacterium]|nr:class I SAM-dependent methyltransferase [bacterium]
MPVNQCEGISVYIQKEISTREHTSPYDAAREWVRRVHREGIVLDLGCSDYVTSRILHEEGIPVVGMDLDMSALRQAQRNTDSPLVVQCDAQNLPLNYENSAVSTVLALDVLEHFPRNEAIEILSSIRRLPNIQNLIVSMPIISPWSMRTMIEGGRAIRNMKWPETGLFDRTHKIFTDQRGHKKMFQKSGFRVVQEESSNWFENITGDWENVIQTVPRFRRPHAKLFGKFVWDILPKMVHPTNKSKRRSVTDRIIAYQGVYLLTPEI